MNPYAVENDLTVFATERTCLYHTEWMCLFFSINWLLGSDEIFVSNQLFLIINYIFLFPEVVNERNTANSHTLKSAIFSHLRHYVSLLLHTIQKYIMFWWCRSVTFVILLELWCLISSNLVSFVMMVWLMLSDLQCLCVCVCVMCVFMLKPVMLLILSYMFWFNVPFGTQNTEVWFYSHASVYKYLIVLLTLFCTDTFVSLLLFISFIYWHRISKEH